MHFTLSIRKFVFLKNFFKILQKLLIFNNNKAKRLTEKRKTVLSQREVNRCIFVILKSPFLGRFQMKESNEWIERMKELPFAPTQWGANFQVSQVVSVFFTDKRVPFHRGKVVTSTNPGTWNFVLANPFWTPLWSYCGPIVTLLWPHCVPITFTPSYILTLLKHNKFSFWICTIVQFIGVSSPQQVTIGFFHWDNFQWPLERY